MASGRLLVADALRAGMLIADRLRQIHDQGGAHGALSPAAVAIAGNAVELLPAPAADAAAYAAPEVLEGKPADARSDIFSFGAILYEMLTGRRAFDGGSAAPRPSGSSAVDRLMSECLAKSPDHRYQRAQKLMLELKLLSSAARRAAPAPPAPAVSEPVAAAPVIPSQMQDLESRIAARFEAQEKAVASVADVANEVLKALRAQQAPPPPPARSFTGGLSRDPHDDRFAARRDTTVDLIADRLARLEMVVTSTVDRLQKLEQNLDAFDIDAAALRDSVTRDIRNFERAIKSQSSAIESARTAMGQTDDLVERVVEALDSLQSMFVATPGEQSLAS